MHPIFKESNVASFGTKAKEGPIGHFDSELFAYKFKASFLKLLEIKGVRLTLKKSETEVLHHPELESTYEDLLVLPVKNEDKLIGLLYLEVHLVSELLHKMMGGADHLAPSLVSFPLSRMEATALENSFGLLSLSLREGLKHALPLNRIDLLQVHKPLNQVDYATHLEKAQDIQVETLRFSSAHGESQLSLCLIIR